MHKDAREYIELILEPYQSGQIEFSEYALLCPIFKFYDEPPISANAKIKKKSILQKYQGDDLIKFSKILKSEIKVNPGDNPYYIDELVLKLLKEE